MLGPSPAPPGGWALVSAWLNGLDVGGWIKLQIAATRLWRSCGDEGPALCDSGCSAGERAA
jgi:hypothetical protein